MHRRCLLPTLVCLATLTMLALVVPATGRAGDNGPPADRWARNVWDAALGGDRTELEAWLDAIPNDAGKTSGLGDQFRNSRDRIRTQQGLALAALAEDRSKALDEMRGHLADGHQTTALRQAVIAQTLGRDFSDAFADEEIMSLVKWARAEIPGYEADRHWIEAQELLYLLKTFYEDTTRRAEYDEYNDELKEVNQRIGLIARYAPRVLYQMRADYVVRAGDEPLPEYNAAREISYQDRLDGVDHHLLQKSLEVAASEHIEVGGWRPLLEGGLDAIEIMATTVALKSVFPTLGDARKVNGWLATVRRFREELKSRETKRIDRRYCMEMINRIVQANDGTVKLPAEMIFREFGDGAMSRLDTYSNIVWPDELRRFEQQTAGDFVGIGVLIRHTDKREVLVVNPLEGTPAYQAGVRPNDVIVEVNGDSTAGWSLNDAVDQITGKKGTTVVIGVKREDVDDVVDIPIVRDLIKIHSIKGWEKIGLKRDGDPIWNWYIDSSSRIAYIRMTQFTNATVEDFHAAWDEVEAKGSPEGLILDLRHNPGGLLTAAVQMSNLFVPQGDILTGEDKNQQAVWRQKAMRHRARLAKVPTVVLVNRGSASASEIVAGCLQAHHAAVIVGERSFGKGSVQTVHHVHNVGRLKLTTQYYRLPSSDGITPGRLVHKRPGATVWGVDPDVEVPMSVNQISEAISLRQRAEMLVFGNGDEGDEEPANINDLIVEGLDPQLATALLLLQAQAVASVDAERHAAIESVPGG